MPFSSMIPRLLPPLIHAVVLAIIVMNWSQPVNLSLGQYTLTQFPLGGALLGVYGLTLAAMGAQLLQQISVIASRMKQFELRKEKAEVRAETQTDQVKALESKIKTLEKALDQALKAVSSTQQR